MFTEGERTDGGMNNVSFWFIHEGEEKARGESDGGCSGWKGVDLCWFGLGGGGRGRGWKEFDGAGHGGGGVLRRGNCRLIGEGG